MTGRPADKPPFSAAGDPENMPADVAVDLVDPVPPPVLTPLASPSRRNHADVADTEAVRREQLLRSAAFRKGREDGWRRLEELVNRIESEGIATLTALEARELPLLYRAAMSSLSVARSIVLDRNLLLYLEDLALRSYLAVYGPRAGILEKARGFFLRGFPRAVRAMRWHLLIVAVALLAGIVAGYLLVMDDMANYTMLVPETLAGDRGPDSTAEDLRRTELFAPWPGFVETFIVFANSLFRHNTMVGIFSFGLGFIMGVPTLLLMAYNGLVVGAMIGLHADKGLGVDFVGWLMIHGVTELLAILLCGGAGLVVAEKILFPGPLSRLDSLAKYGRDAAGVVAGTVAMFFIAGILEGGFRQLVHQTPLRYAFALATAAGWLYYFARAGRGEPDGDSQ